MLCYAVLCCAPLRCDVLVLCCAVLCSLFGTFSLEGISFLGCMSPSGQGLGAAAWLTALLFLVFSLSSRGQAQVHAPYGGACCPALLPRWLFLTVL